MRQSFQLLHDKLSVDGLAARRPMALIVATDQAPTIDFIPFLSQYTNPFTRKLPAVRNVAFTANLAFVAIEQINFSVSSQGFYKS